MPQLGARGGGWVALQFALIAAILSLGVVGPDWPDSVHWWFKGAGSLIAVAGVLVIVSASRALGSSLTPFPRPPEAGELVERGPYGVVRHPIYTGVTLLLAGISLALSWWSLVGTALLAVLFALKLRVEERLLAERYPTYAEYRERTRYRLVPFVY